MVIDYYSVLGVSPDAGYDEIRAAYRRLAKQWHPDRYGNSTENERLFAEEMFKKINQAYHGIMEGEGRGEWNEPEDKTRNTREYASSHVRNDDSQTGPGCRGSYQRSEEYSYGTYGPAWSEILLEVLDVAWRMLRPVLKIAFYLALLCLVASVAVGAVKLVIWIIGFILSSLVAVWRLLIIGAVFYLLYCLISIFI